MISKTVPEVIVAIAHLVHLVQEAAPENDQEAAPENDQEVAPENVQEAALENVQGAVLRSVLEVALEGVVVLQVELIVVGGIPQNNLDQDGLQEIDPLIKSHQIKRRSQKGTTGQ